MELDGKPSVAVLLDRQNMAAKRLALTRQMGKPAQKTLGLVAIPSHDLDDDGLMVIVLLDQKGQRSGPFADEEKGPLDTGELAAVRERHIRVFDRAHLIVFGKRGPRHLRQPGGVILILGEDAELF